jgi:predicted dinucleotide-binding enzyme
MTIAIIGAGKIGTAIARALARANIPATLASRRGKPELYDLARSIGPSITAGTMEEAARADIVFVAVNWSQLPQALADLPAWDGRIVIDTNNPIEAPLFKPAELHGRTSSEVFADLVPGARVVKAFNHLRPQLISQEPDSEGGRTVLFYAGDDVAAKAQVAQLIEQLGFFGLDLGPLATGGRLTQFPGGSLPTHHFVRLG